MIGSAAILPSNPAPTDAFALTMTAFVTDAIRSFTETGTQDESSLPLLQALQDRHSWAFPILAGMSRYYYKVECPDDAMAMHASKVMDTSMIDKACFAAMTAELEEVTFKDMWTKEGTNY